MLPKSIEGLLSGSVTRLGSVQDREEHASLTVPRQKQKSTVTKTPEAKQEVITERETMLRIGNSRPT